MVELDFTSKRDDGDQEDPPVEVPFRLDGQRFLCVLRRDGDAVLEWSELAAGATQEDINSPAGAAFVSRFFRLMMPPDQYAAFRAHMKANHTHRDLLVEIMQGVNEKMEEVVEADTSRPSQPSSSSSRGRGVRDERTAKIISLSADDGDIEYTAPKPQARRQQGRRGRRAG